MKKICIVASKYYEDIINMLIDGANEAIGNHKKKFKTNIIYVPGVFEIPHVISKKTYQVINHDLRKRDR